MDACPPPHLPPGRTDLTVGLVIWRPGPKSCIPLGKFARFCFLGALGSPCWPLGLAGCLLGPSCFHFCFPSGHRASILPATWLLFSQSCRILGALGSPFLPLGLAGVAPLAILASCLLLIGASGVYLGRNLAPCPPILPHLVDTRWKMELIRLVDRARITVYGEVAYVVGGGWEWTGPLWPP